MRRPYTVRSAQYWDQARDAYLAGETADAVCRRFNLGLSAFRKRARAHGWRRQDQPADSAARYAPNRLPPDHSPTARLLAHAQQGLRDAANRNQMRQVEAWMAQIRSLTWQLRHEMQHHQAALAERQGK